MKKILFILFLTFSTVSIYAQSKEIAATVTTTEVKNITISPNPAVSDIKIMAEGTQSSIKSISIYSIIGNEVLSKSYSGTQSVGLDVRNLKKGKYIVRVIFDDNTTEVATLVKQ